MGQNSILSSSREARKKQKETRGDNNGEIKEHNTSSSPSSIDCSKSSRLTGDKEVICTMNAQGPLWNCKNRRY